MKKRRVFCALLALVLCVSLCTPILADGDILFVAVNDSIPLTLSALPYESSSGIYVPYTAFDASPGGVIPAYNAQAQTFVLFTRQRRLVFDLAEGTVTDQDGNVKTVSTTFRGGMLYVPLVYCASFFGLKVTLLKSENGYPHPPLYDRQRGVRRLLVRRKGREPHPLPHRADEHHRARAKSLRQSAGHTQKSRAAGGPGARAAARDGLSRVYKRRGRWRKMLHFWRSIPFAGPFS